MLYSADQIKQYEELFKKKMYRVEDIDYQAWLLYKWDSVGSEDEAFNHVLKKRKPANMVPKKTRQKVAPEGAARYHMNDSAWDDIFRVRMANENKKKRGGKKASTVAVSTVTSGALEEESVASSVVTSAATLSSPNDDNISTSISRGSDNVSGTIVDDDCDQDLPDIREPIVTNTGMRPTMSSDAYTTISKNKKRKGNSSITRKKRVKVTTTESGSRAPSAPKFPLESGISPLIDDNDDDDYINNSSNNNDISTLGAKKVIPVISTFLDTMDGELNQIVAVSRPQPPETLGNNNSNSRKLRSRVSSSAPSSGVSKPQASESQVKVNQGLEDPASQTDQVVNSTKKKKLSKLSLKRSSFTSTVTSVCESASTSTFPGSSGPISMVNDITDGKQIKDKKMIQKGNITRKMKFKPKMNAKMK